jgi:pimeloyl-ACP methyl ester carboxylesterase
MARHVRRWSLMPSLLVAISPVACLNFLNPVPRAPTEMIELSEQLPKESRLGVYVFLINGNDPLGCANLYGIRDYLNRLGFVKSYYGELYHKWWLEDEIRELHKEKPDARIVVIGYEYGADVALGVAQAGADAGAQIDALIYLEPRGLSFDQVSESQDRIRRVVVVRKEKSYLNDTEVHGAETVTVPCFCRYLVPTHPTTLDAVSTEVTNLAMSVPVIGSTPIPFPQILDDPAPTPRQVIGPKPAALDEWDFLKPVGRRKEQVELIPAPREAQSR